MLVRQECVSVEKVTGQPSLQHVTEEAMATTAYEDALRAVERLTPEERLRLRSDLTQLDLAYGPPSGAAFVAMLDANLPDPTVWEEIGRIIEDECERIDPSTW